MGARLQRVEALLRREIADAVLFGNLRDPRLQPSTSISITAVRVSADLSAARVYVDVLDAELRLVAVLAALNASAAVVRRAIAPKIRLKRVPALKFEHDQSIEQGATIERVLRELDAEPGPDRRGDDEE